MTARKQSVVERLLNEIVVFGCIAATRRQVYTYIVTDLKADPDYTADRRGECELLAEWAAMRAYKKADPSIVDRLLTWEEGLAQGII